jgi:hypothetical protein
MSPTTPISSVSRPKRSAVKRRRSARVMAEMLSMVPETGLP